MATTTSTSGRSAVTRTLKGKSECREGLWQGDGPRHEGQEQHRDHGGVRFGRAGIAALAVPRSPRIVH